MCTMTWLFQDDGYELFFNRDELRTRLIAYPPTLHSSHGVSFVAPIDADAGGTWMGVNAFGLSVCLLNGAGHKVAGRSYQSRGLLPMALLDCPDQETVLERMRAMQLETYRPFMLVVLQPGMPVVAWVWDGVRSVLQNAVSCPLVSSSFRFFDVAAHRQRLFAGLGTLRAKALTDFHRSHVPEAGPFSVCMHRDDAQTVSLSRVVVTGAKAEFYYTPGLPCQTEFLPPVCLARIPMPSTAT